MPFVVLVDDNFHFTDESERYTQGEYATFDEAKAVCKKIVDEFLAEQLAHDPKLSADKLYEIYVQFGEDPFIVGGKETFSAWDYAQLRSRQLCGKT